MLGQVKCMSETSHGLVIHKSEAEF